MASLREGRDAERIRWGEANLCKAKAKVAEKQEVIEGLNRAVRQSEKDLAAVAARVKVEEVDEVVELDVDAEEMEGEIVKEEEEAQVEVARRARGGGGGEPLAHGDGGVEGCGGPPRPTMGPGCPGWPPPPKPGHPPPRRPGLSGFCWCGCTTGCWGRGGWYGLTRGGVVHLDKPPRLGVVNGLWGWQRELPGPGKRWGEVPPPKWG